MAITSIRMPIYDAILLLTIKHPACTMPAHPVTAVGINNNLFVSGSTINKASNAIDAQAKVVSAPDGAGPMYIG